MNGDLTILKYTSYATACPHVFKLCRGDGPRHHLHDRRQRASPPRNRISNQQPLKADLQLPATKGSHGPCSIPMSLFFLPCRRLFSASRASILPSITPNLGSRHLSNSAIMSHRADREGVQHPRPSSSVVLLSPENQVLLLHRVQTSTSFASAHVFPGGNLDPFHDGNVPDVGARDMHRDGPSYRIGAIRETFEETGILLAKRKYGNGELVSLETEERDAARKRIHGNEVNFTEWVESVGGIPDTGNFVFQQLSNLTTNSSR